MALFFPAPHSYTGEHVLELQGHGGPIVIESVVARAGAHVQPAIYVDEDMRIEVALRRMQRSGQRLAIVLGRDGRELGTLDLQDVLEVIFGEVSL